MTKPTDKPPVDWQAEIEREEQLPPNSIEMQYFVNKMPPGRSEFTAKEVADILGYSDSKMVYYLCEQGLLGYLARPTHRQRSYIFPRVALLRYLRENCNKAE